jgi:hypothetical protein
VWIPFRAREADAMETFATSATVVMVGRRCLVTSCPSALSCKGLL